jgi:acyl-CoA thioester hydrolase
MPLVLRFPARVPWHELNAFGEVRGSALARLLQDVAGLASTHVGYPAEWFERNGMQWIVRRTATERHAPVRQGGDDVEVTTWVADFRRVQSRREYEVRRREDGQLLATASTDWVYVTWPAARPARVSPEMMAAFLPDADGVPVERSPVAVGEPPAGATTVRHVVGFHDLDTLGHANNARWFDWVEEALLAHVTSRAASGLAELLAGGRSLRIVRRDLEYLRGAALGDEISCTAWGDGDQATVRVHRAADGRDLARCRFAWTLEASTSK